MEDKIFPGYWDSTAMKAIISKGTIAALQAEISKCDEEGIPIDMTVSWVRQIIDVYDQFFHTGRC